MLTAIATSKSTVLGLRLDHDRRAWVEAAAAQAGQTVRGFFEGLIDRARLEAAGGSAEPEAPDEPTQERLGEPTREATTADTPALENLGTVEDAPPAPDRARGVESTTLRRRPPPRRGPEVPRVLFLPGQMLSAATSATATLIESGGRCLRDSWRVFVVTLLQDDEDGWSWPDRS